MSAPSSDQIVVFAGPSLPASARPGNVAFRWLGPAAAGDALRLLAQGAPRVVVLIDGLFDEAPAIRHKELLLLMAAGVHLVGGASMGALRACELAPFGMIGCGRIFEAYARGQLVADDEVALTHGPAYLDWAPLSEPLVNVRATLMAAVRARTLEATTARALRTHARSIHFTRRTWDGLLADWPGARSAIRRFETWLPEGKVDVKRVDALVCLRTALTLEAVSEPRAPPPPTAFTASLQRWVEADVDVHEPTTDRAVAVDGDVKA